MYDPDDQVHHRLIAALFPLFKVFFNPAHSIGDMRKTNHRTALGLCKGVKCRGFHFDRQESFGSSEGNRRLRLPERRVGCPYTALHDAGCAG